MFARVGVPCVAVAENMASFKGDDGRVYYPFGTGAGERIAKEFGIPRVVRFPIDPKLAAAGDSGIPLVASDPACDVAQAMMELGGAVVRELAVASVRTEEGGRPGGAGGARARGRLEFDPEGGDFVFSPPRGGAGAWSSSAGSPPPSSSSSGPVRLPAVSVRDSDRSAAAIDEWTGAPLRPAASSLPPESLVPSEAPRPVGNYAVQITWGDGVSQLSTFEQLNELAAAVRAEEKRRGGGGVKEEGVSARV